MDNFAEQLVKRQMTGSERTKMIATTIGGTIIVIVLVLLSVLALGNGSLTSFIGLLLAAGAGYGTYFLTQNMQVEYEYIFTNGTLDVAKIIAKKRRKELLSTEVSTFTDFGKYSDNLKETDDMTVIIVSDNLASGEYYADFTHEEYGNSRLIFSPNENMLENIKRSLPRSLKNNI